MQDPHIRPVTPDDLPRLAHMVNALAAFNGDIGTCTPADLARDIFGAAPLLTVLVAELDNGLIGYAALCPFVQLQFGARHMDLHHLFVVPNMRGSGVGRALIGASITYATEHGCGVLTVGTSDWNEAAQAAYVNAGFTRRPTSGVRFAIKLAQTS